MRKDSGFTFLELMVVIAIIAIAASIAIPSMIPWPAKHRMGGATREIYAAMQYAKLRAVKEKANVIIIFNDTGFGATDTYTVFIDNGSGGGTPRNNSQDGTEPTIKTGQMPVDVDMSSALFNATTITGFDPRGLPIFDGVNYFIGSVRLSNTQRNLYRRVRLGFSGIPVIESSVDGNPPWA
jgi:type IV fimbrial biogenesis protein FimT